jgi:rhodanese-related sulfurtransferase
MDEELRMVENVSPQTAWAALTHDPDAQLVDCRTDAEWQYVGLPDLRAAGKQPVLVSWQYYPSGALNAAFVEQLHESGLQPAHRIYFLCRSGVRSRAAAEMAKTAGFTTVFNVADGFEGPPDPHGHRGTTAGWKAAGLPWSQ